MWLLHHSAKDSLNSLVKSGLVPSAQQQLEYEASFGSNSGGSRIMAIDGETAMINISGALSSAPNLLAYLLGEGNTTYSDIIAALKSAEQNPDIKKITLNIDSPGGTVSGLFDAIGEMESITKPMKAVVSNVAASAAYAIACQADEIVATNDAARFGSVGVVVHTEVFAEDIAIASTNAPKKAPNLLTDEGVDMVREELDALHEVFVDSISRGRSVSSEKINADFGQGATLLAKEALKRGMIDGVADYRATSSVDSITTANNGVNLSEIKCMDINTLKASHPDLYLAVFEEGVSKERERVNAHLIAGEMSGDMKNALSFAKDGTEMSMSLQTQYMMAAANRRDIADRQDDDSQADEGSTNSAASTEADSFSAILKLAAENCGVELEA